MKSGIYVKASSVVNANGSYMLNNSDELPVSQQVFIAADKLHVLRYVVTETSMYVEMPGSVFMPDVVYYQVDQYGEMYEAEVTVGGTKPDGENYYISQPVIGWLVQKIVGQDTINGYIYGEPVLMAPTTDTSKYPSDTSLVWYNMDGVREHRISVSRFDESSYITEVSEPVVDEEAGTTSVTTTITNIITGDIIREVSIVQNKTVYQTKDYVRYDSITLALNKIYRFQFSSVFQPLGHDPEDKTVNNKGIFKVLKILNYEDVLYSGVDLYANLYRPLGLPEEMFEKDKDLIAQSVVYKLIDPTDDNIVLYMPQIFIEGTPDASVEKYNKTMLTIDIGTHGDVELLSDIQTTLAALMEKLWGITSTDGTPLAKLTIYDNIWLTITQKEQLDQERRYIRDNSQVDLSDMFEFEKTNGIYLENRQLKSKCAALQDIIVQHAIIPEK